MLNFLLLRVALLRFCSPLLPKFYSTPSAGDVGKASSAAETSAASRPIRCGAFGSHHFGADGAAGGARSRDLDRGRWGVEKGDLQGREPHIRWPRVISLTV